MRRDLREMVVAITGASAGIGKALAERLAAAGARLALCARRVEKLEALNAALGGAHLVVRADVAQRGDCEQFVERAMERFGRIDTLIANAGYGLYRRTHEMDGDEVRRMFATNVFGTTDLVHAAVPHMLRQPVDPGGGIRGQIVIVSSAAARRGVPFLGPYAATKAAQLSIAEALRVELRPHRIAVTSVHPIMTKTEFGQIAEQSGDVKLPRDKRVVTQTVDQVARAMVRGIERPRPEVWPHRPSRWALGLATLTPRLTDRLMKKYMREVERVNPPPAPPAPAPPAPPPPVPPPQSPPG